MKVADIPSNEKSRLEALYRYEVLDTDMEKVFDELTELASEICDTPIALISLIDADRQWFKSKVGLSADETHRDIAFCAHAIHQEEVFEVSDTFLDERFKDNPLVTESPNIRSYAGAPLITPEGFAIGTLCAINDKPKKLDAHQIKALKTLGKQVVTQLQLRLKIKEVESANERKTDFLSNLSHELRTPLNAIVSFSKLMIDDKTFDLPDKQKQYLKHLDYSGRRLLSLVNSVLDLNKIESGNFTLEYTSIHAKTFFESIHSITKTLAAKKSLVVNFSCETNENEYFQTDETRLSQIILNLVSNAIKFSPNEQTIDIKIKLSSAILVVAVRDEGIGIAKKDLHLIFEKFQQVRPNENQEGSGLGLMITKSLVEHMHGSIKLSSKLGQGSLFKVKLPICTENTFQQTDIPSQTQHTFNPNAKILVVEDNLINQEVAKAMFHTIGISISVCGSGEDAIKKLKSDYFDLIFMDLHLPGIDGFETSKKITSMDPDQKIVALTADVFSKADSKLARNGIQAYISKPASESDLISVLNKYCPN